MADISLGGPISYYSGFPNDANAVEALKRWDNGVRVTNSNRFERHVEDGGPGITYEGTYDVIDGMDVKLSTDQPAYRETRVRYIMAVLSLGGPISYYRGFPDDANAVEALRRWDNGVRVTNKSYFERHVEDGGPGITYRGTRTVIDGMDVKLTTDY
jgi:hypothetical protein